MSREEESIPLGMKEKKDGRYEHRKCLLLRDGSRVEK